MTQRGIQKFHVDGTTDTGANYSTLFGPVQGQIFQVAYGQGDTGVRLDTGAEVFVRLADTGEIGQGPSTLFHTHLVGSWRHGLLQRTVDTGGNAFLYAAGGAPVGTPIVLAGEMCRVSVQGIATDTGKTFHFHIWAGS